MDQIILELNLRYVLSPLTMAQRGELLTALFDGQYQGQDTMVDSVFRYIEILQKEKEKKHRHMKEISAKGVAARQQKQTDGEAMVNQRLKRKEAKEKDNKSINKKNIIFSAKDKFLQRDTKPEFTAPSVAEVEAYVSKHGYAVKAETFVDFYEARGWMVGKTPIRCWQSMVKLWHNRANQDETKAGATVASQRSAEEENYWHQLAQRTEQNTPILPSALPQESIIKPRNAELEKPSPATLAPPKEAPIAARQLSADTPFKTFAELVEKYKPNNKEQNNE